MQIVEEQYSGGYKTKHSAVDAVKEGQPYLSEGASVGVSSRFIAAVCNQN